METVMFLRSPFLLITSFALAAVGCGQPDDEPAGTTEDAIDSSYGPQTDLGVLDEQCTNRGDTPGWKNWVCEGFDGYQLVVGVGTSTGRHRVSIRKFGAESDLGVLRAIPEGGKAGPKAEWRQTGVPGELGLVFRYADKLVVNKISPSASCVYSAGVSSRREAHAAIASQAFRDFQCPATRRAALPADSPAGCGVMHAGGGIASGKALQSCSGAFGLYMQEDGNLVLYRQADFAPLWSSDTWGSGATGAYVEPDGTFAIYNDTWNPTPIWAKERGVGKRGVYLAVQDDGNVVLYSATGSALFATNTAQ